MKKFQAVLPHFVAILGFVLVSVFYFYPVLQGDKIYQSDIVQYVGMAKEQNDFRQETNSEPFWTNSAFGGMPTYQLGANYPHNYVKKLDTVLRFLPRPADYLFLYFLGFYILLMVLKVDPLKAFFGAVAFGLSTYLIIILGVGHNAKAHAIAYMPMVMAGVLWVFQKKYLLGFIVTAIAMALEINSNHPQMTYYLGFCLLILGVVEGIHAIKQKTLSIFLKQVLIILGAVILGVGANSPRLLAMKEYADASTRGKSELTINPDGSPKEATKGLDKDYITQFSYAKLETFNLFIPRFMGGGTVEKLDDNSEFYQLIEEKAGKKVADDYSKQVLTYWEINQL